MSEDLIKKETEEAEVVSVKNNLFEATGVTRSADGSYLTDVLTTTFKGAKEYIISRKAQDIETYMKREIEDSIRQIMDLKSDVQNKLMSLAPTGPLEKLNLSTIDPKDFTDYLFNWGAECNKKAKSVLNKINVYQNMFRKEWNKNEKDFIKGMIIDFESI